MLPKSSHDKGCVHVVGKEGGDLALLASSSSALLTFDVVQWMPHKNVSSFSSWCDASAAGVRNPPAVIASPRGNVLDDGGVTVRTSVVLPLPLVRRHL